ncbi:MAG: hypothetical protein LBT16_14650 [Treponema sp.]|jgi:hypothetical protein|nr:hypothetical protein [Treponema sp.]
MGEVTATITLANTGDVSKALDRLIKEMEVRQATVTTVPLLPMSIPIPY